MYGLVGRGRRVPVSRRSDKGCRVALLLEGVSADVTFEIWSFAPPVPSASAHGQEDG